MWQKSHAITVPPWPNSRKQETIQANVMIRTFSQQKLVHSRFGGAVMSWVRIETVESVKILR
jgi:hypothetical protein